MSVPPVELICTTRVPLREIDKQLNGDVEACKAQITEQANKMRADNGLPHITLDFTVSDTHLCTEYVWKIIDD